MVTRWRGAGRLAARVALAAHGGRAATPSARGVIATDIRKGALAYPGRVNAAGGVHRRKIGLTTLDDAN